jgi:tetratricopeptide (TPR) repeat protein
MQATDETLDGDATGDEPARARGSGRVEPARGDTIGRYVVLGRVGAGGMGVVYAAYDPELDRKIALKILHTSQAGSGGSVRLLREAQALARLGHPNVVAVHDVGQTSDGIFIAMEFVEGRTLGAWLAHAPRTQTEILHAFAQVGRGLCAAHDKGLVHRDLKPDNVMLGDDGRARVMDFGLARRAVASEPASAEVDAEDSVTRPTRGALEADITRHDSVLGTPAYMAPEQHTGGDVGPAADQFAFCVALYEALYRERPFAGDTLASLAFSVCSGEVRPPPPHSGVPTWLRRVLLRGLGTDPGARWPSLAALCGALERDPTRRRRRAFAFGGVLVAVVGIGAAPSILRARAAAECEREGAAIASTWTDERAQTIASAFAALGSSRAEETWDRVEPRLGAWVADWAHARTRVCLEARVSDTRAAESRDMANACLDAERAWLAETLDTLGTPDLELVDRAVEVVAEHAPASECTDVAALLRRPTAPADASTREEVEALRSELSGAVAVRELGRLEPSRARIEAVVERAEALAYAPLHAEALYELGKSESDADEHDRAASTLRRAFLLAGANRHDEVALDAAISLARVTGQEQAKLDATLEWAETAKMFAARLGVSDDLAGAAAASAMGIAHGTRGDYEAAIAEMERVLEIHERVLGAEHPSLATALSNLGGLHARRGARDEAIAMFRRGLDIAETTLGPDHPDVATLLNGLGSAQMARGDLDDALVTLRRALEIREARFGPKNGLVAMTMHNIANVHLMADDLDDALASYERALEIKKNVYGQRHPTVASTLANIGVVHQYAGRPEPAIAAYRQSLEIQLEVMGPDHADTATSYGNLGNVYKQQGRYEEALEGLGRAAAIYEASLGPASPELATAIDNIADVHLARGEIDLARSHYERALESRAAAAVPAGELADTRFGLAKALVEGDDPDLPRALELSREAVAGYRSAHREEEAAEIDAWIVAHAR